MNRRDRIEFKEIEGRLETAEDKLSEIMFCSECGDISKKRIDVSMTIACDLASSESRVYLYPLSKADKENIDGRHKLCTARAVIPHCRHCDEKVAAREAHEEKVKEAIEVAKSCPDAVIKAGKRKACKEESSE
jgi:hypothetical protein